LCQAKSKAATLPGTPAESPQHREPAWALGNSVADRYSHRDEDDHYTQPRSLFQPMNPGQQQRLIDNIAGSMRGITRLEPIPKQLAHFKQINEKPAAGIAAGLGGAKDQPALQKACAGKSPH
jgi:catalase